MCLPRARSPPVYPRVGGGNACASEARPLSVGLSPRGRGKRLRCADGGIGDRSIPAWAGETATTKTPRMTRRVYPRVGGGNAVRLQAAEGKPGLSPRGRGKPHKAY